MNLLPPSLNCKKQMQPVILLAMLTLAGCGSQGPALSPEAMTASHNQAARPLSCAEFKPVTVHAGKITAAGQPDIAKEDVLARLGLPDWLAQLHRLFGDTDDTIKASKANNAVWAALCGP